MTGHCQAIGCYLTRTPKTTGGIITTSPRRQSEEIHTSLIIETLKTIGGLIYHSNPRRQSEDIIHHLPLGPRRQPEASFIILIPVDNRRILDIIYHWDSEDNRRPHLSLSPRRQPVALFIIQVSEDNQRHYLTSFA
ncbi:hypothetical protein H5410_059005 [Solanum commersonii]|uniref:Uncharacterized protein n=1 Tax=Solanum commersonii TaxID=4109 RepID=A0A9J5W1J2_SOLCO|nr:hypothetical protein H5410_059005 [Solanum commersonii]